MIAEGEQRTPEGYESRLGPLGRFFGFPTSYVGNLLLRQWAEEGGMVANPVSPSDACGMAGCAISGLVIAPSSQWVALASAGAGRCELPAPVRIVPYRRAPAGFQVQSRH